MIDWSVVYPKQQSVERKKHLYLNGQMFFSAICDWANDSQCTMVIDPIRNGSDSLDSNIWQTISRETVRGLRE